MEAGKLPLVGIGVLIVNSSQQLLLGCRKGSHASNTWGPPGGTLDWGESFEDCAVRETFEEAGISLHPEDVRILGIANDYFETEAKHYVSIFTHVSLTQNATAHLKEPHKCAAWQWFSQDQLPTPLFPPIARFMAENQSQVFAPSKKAAA